MRDETAAGPVSCGTAGRVRRGRNVPFVVAAPERGGASLLPVCRVWKIGVVMLAATGMACGSEAAAAAEKVRIATTGTP